jgi:hypothetical protein
MRVQGYVIEVAGNPSLDLSELRGAPRRDSHFGNIAS